MGRNLAGHYSFLRKQILLHRVKISQFMHLRASSSRICQIDEISAPAQGMPVGQLATPISPHFLYDFNLQHDPQMIVCLFLKAAYSSLFDCVKSPFIGACPYQTISISTLRNRQPQYECKPPCRAAAKPVIQHHTRPLSLPDAFSSLRRFVSSPR